MNLIAVESEPINIVASDGFANLGNITIAGLVSFLITAILIISAIIFFFMLILGGLRWITSGGDKANTETARNQITAALIGLIIVFSAFAITNLVGSIFGFSFTELNFGNVIS